MRLLRMISGMVFLVRPPCALPRRLTRILAAIVRGVRPTTALTRACYVLLGIVLLFGALWAEMAGQRNYAIALSLAGVILVFLRQIAPLVTQANNTHGQQKPSDLLRSGWTRKGVAVNGIGEPVLSDSPAAVAWSLSGAVNAVFEPDSRVWRSYMGTLQTLVGHNLIRWNGDSGRTQNDVVAVALNAEMLIATEHTARTSS